MGFGPAYGTGKGGGVVDIFTKKDGNPAIFTNTGARDTYFTSNPDELAKVKSSGDAVAIGTANQITAAYIYRQNIWQAIATNFKGDKGSIGPAGPAGPSTSLDADNIVKNIEFPSDTEIRVVFYSGASTTIAVPKITAVSSIAEAQGDLEITFTNGTRKVVPLPSQTPGSGTVVKTVGEEGSNLKVTYTNGNEVNLPLTPSTLPMHLTADMISNAINHGDAPNTGSIKALSDGWWRIPFSNTELTGRPSGTDSKDLVYFKQTVGGSSGSDSIGLIFGEDKNGDASLWAQYRINGFWSPWFKEDGSGGGDNIYKALEALQKGQTSALQKIQELKTQVGNIFAPTKSALDAEIQVQLSSVENDIASMKARLAALEAGHTGGGGGHPLPSQVPHLAVTYALSQPTTEQGLGTVLQHTSGVITRSTTDAEYIFVSVVNTNNYADKVTGISIDRGLPAIWTYNDATIGSTQYRIFRSPGKFFDQTNNIEVIFSN